MVNNPEKQRYELWLGDELVGEIRYGHKDGDLVLIHTEIFPGHRGEGLADVLAQGALNDLKARGIEYRVICPFVAAYLRRHPQS